MGAERPAYLCKSEEFSLQLSLIESALLLPPDVKDVTSTARWDSLYKIPIAVKLFYYYMSHEFIQKEIDADSRARCFTSL